MKKYTYINSDTISVSEYNESGPIGEELIIEIKSEGFRIGTFSPSLLKDDNLLSALIQAEEHCVDMAADMEQFLELYGIGAFVGKEE